MTSVEKRRNFIINLVYFAIIAGLFYLFIKYAFGIFFPFIFAFFIAIILQRPINVIVKKTHFKKGLTSVIMVLLVLGILVSFVVLLGGKIVSEFQNFASFIMTKLNDIAWIEKTLYAGLSYLPDFLQKSLSGTVDNFISDLQDLTSNSASKTSTGSLSIGSLKLSSLISPSISGVWSFVSSLPSILLAVLITIISCCFLTADYDRFVNMIKGFFPKNKRFLFSRTKQILFKSLGKLGKAYLIIMCITFTEILLGLFIMKLVGVYNGSYMFVIAALTALIDILPIFGSGMVIIPWALYSLFTGDTGFGIGLIVMYIIMVIVRQIMEPKLVAAQLDLPPIITIMAMYVGLQIFGFVGLFLLPITLFCVKLLADDGVISLKAKDNVGEEAIEDEKGQPTIGI